MRNPQTVRAVEGRVHLLGVCIFTYPHYNRYPYIFVKGQKKYLGSTAKFAFLIFKIQPL